MAVAVRLAVACSPDDAVAVMLYPVDNCSIQSTVQDQYSLDISMRLSTRPAVGRAKLTASTGWHCNVTGYDSSKRGRGKGYNANPTVLNMIYRFTQERVN